MKNLPERYDRNIRFFGKDGQRKLQQTRVALIGVGGLGSPMVQHLALLGVDSVTLVDDQELDETNRNRFIGARHDDPVQGSPKVQLAARLIGEINPDVEAKPIQKGLVSPEAFEAVKGADWVFGCFVEDGPRLCPERAVLRLRKTVHRPRIGHSQSGRLRWPGLYCMGRTQLPALPQFARSERCPSLPVK